MLIFCIAGDEIINCLSNLTHWLVGTSHQLISYKKCAMTYISGLFFHWFMKKASNLEKVLEFRENLEFIKEW